MLFEMQKIDNYKVLNPKQDSSANLVRNVQRNNAEERVELLEKSLGDTITEHCLLDVQDLATLELTGASDLYKINLPARSECRFSSGTWFLLGCPFINGQY